MQMDYDQVPTTVFTPIEYGCTGLAEEDAIAKYGEENIETFHSFFKPLEWQVPHKQDNACYMKMICNKLDSFRVIGFHVLGPNAGEVNQGVGVAIKCGATKEDFDNTVGIHPTIAEEMTTLDVTKSSGAPPSGPKTLAPCPGSGSMGLLQDSPATH
jgi:pyruvate/2-oxoglutarate dehydrogenase complex dihydrolipoamide dehydrogenase (E3) component